MRHAGELSGSFNYLENICHSSQRVYWILNYNLPPFAGSADFFYLTYSAYLAGYLVAYQWIYKSP